jgi:HK97 gp10 family phage protein
MADTKTLHGLDGVLAALKALPPEIVSKNGGPVKSALRKGGVVIQKAAQENVRRVVTNTQAKGYTSTEVLEKAIVVRRDPNPQRSGAAERYRVLIARGRKYGDRLNKKGGKPLTAVMTGRWLEFGDERQPAEPWMTPAFMSSKERALSTVVDELRKGVDRAIRKVSKGS